MICDNCKKETDTIFVVEGYIRTYNVCAECFGNEEDDDE